MKKFIHIYVGLFLCCFFIGINSASAQLTYTDDFSANKGTTQVTSGLMGTSGANNWFVNSSGADWGAIRSNTTSQLELTNDASATANANGWVFAQTVTQHHPTLNLNTDVTWNFNMRQITTDPGGFTAGSHGVAFVLAGSSATAATVGQGYAVVLGQSGTTDPVRLVHYNTGLQGTLTNIVTSNTTGLTDFGADYLSVRVVYTAATNTWQLLLRNDGATAFADPSTGTLTSQGTPAANSTATGTPLSFMGAYWQGGMVANQTAFFDNVRVVANTGAFVTTWIPDGTATSLTIPTTGTGYSYAATCQNMTTSTTAATALTGQTGDATFSSLTAASTYRVFITGTFPRIYFSGGTERDKIRTIEQWGTIAWTSMNYAFTACTNLTTANGNPNLTGVTDMSSMFLSCTNFNGNISGWNTAAVTNMTSMFQGCTAFNQNIGTWNTANVTDMTSVFFGCTAFNQNIGAWNTAKVTKMNSMFSDCKNFNANISGWTMTAVTGMNSMFSGTTAFNQDIGTWTTTAVTDMGYMFYNATAFNKAIGTWNTTTVTNMSAMFLNATAFNKDISTWNTAAVTNMTGIFNGATAFNQNLGNWTLNASVNLSSMLGNSGMDCTNYSNTLAAWAVKPGLPTGRSLGATGRNYGTDAAAARSTLTTATASGGKGWTITDGGVSTGACLTPEINVQGNTTNIVDGSTTPSATNHTDFGSVGVGSTLVRTYTIQNIGFAALTISSITSNNTKFVIGTAPTSIAVGATATFTVTYTPTATGTDNATITINNNDSDEAVYDFAVAGTAFSPFTTRWNLATTGSSTTGLTFGVATVAAGTVNYTWKSTTTTASGSGTFTGTTCTITGLPTNETILLSIAPTNFQRININFGTDRSRLTAIEAWGDVAWTSMNNAFYGCTNLTTATGNPTLTGVTDMSYMFGNCTNFNGAVTAWNTAAVTTMSNMFNGCTKFNGDVTAWNTAAVTNMNAMFFGCTIFNGNITGWNTAAATDMSSMFQNTTAFNQPIGTWNTVKVTNMSSMFNGATAFNQPVGTWNTAAVTNMSTMFSGATIFNQNLGAWTLNATVNLGSMLNNAGMDCANYSATLVAWAAKSGLPTGRTLGASGRQYGTDAAAARTVLTTATTSGGKGWTITDGGVSTGTCLSPEINVQGNTTNIVDGSTTPSATNHTAFGDVGVGSLLIRTYTIQNLGGLTLTISSISSNNTKFVIGTAPTSIAVGASATFTVTYTPTFTGTDDAAITINNNDSDEAVYDFAVTGTAVNAFITRWNLATTGSSTTGLTFGVATSGTVAYTWKSTTTTASGSGTFTGTTCTITGLPANQTILLSIAPTNFQRFIMNNGTDRSRLTTIEAWGNVAWTNMGSAFAGCTNLTTATGNPILTGVTDMYAMFNNCTNFNGNITGWNTATVTGMGFMFGGCTNFNANISGWNTAKVVDMSYMFYDCTNFNGNISGWNTAAVTNMNTMFSSCTLFNANISGWSTANVTNMSFMFNACTKFNGNVTAWNTAKVTSMSFMFFACTNFNANISGWNTAKVVDMSYMFYDCTNFNANISGWNTAAVTNMSGMFSDATAFNQNLGNWTLNATVSLASMLDNSGMDCANYSATLAAWAAKPGLPTGRSLDATGRPYGTDVVAARSTLTTTTASGGKGWTISGDVASTSACLATEINVQGNANNITDGSTVPSATNHTAFGDVGISSLLVRTYTIQNTGWFTLTISSITSNNTKFVIGTAPTSIAAGASATFTVTYNPTATGTDNATITINNNDSDEAVYDFAITGTAVNAFRTSWNLAATTGSGATQLVFGVATVTAGTVAYTWKSKTTTASGSGTFTGTPAGSSFCTITGLPAGDSISLSIAPTNFQAFIMNNGSDKSRLTAIDAWGDVSWTTMIFAFTGCNNLTTATGNPILSGVTDMSYTFFGCTKFNANISGWNTANVTNMRAIFQLATAFNQPIGTWNTANVTDMYAMFSYATAFNQNLGNWNTANVTTMLGMFEDATSFNQNLGNWTLNANVDLTYMLGGSGMDCANYSATLAAWAAKPGLPTGRTFGATGRNYGTDAVAARTTLTTTKGWTITGDVASGVVCSVALPIELISFTGKNEKTQNLLYWKTATETNNEGFNIETSKDGVNFQFLAFVKGQGTTSKAQNYTFTHRLTANESGVLYYRLKQMDFDGKFEYSKTIAIRNEGKQNSIVVYPNPSNGLYTISLDEKAEIEQISLMSITGQSIDVNMTDNQLDLSNEPTGVYFLQVNGQNIKLIKN